MISHSVLKGGENLNGASGILWMPNRQSLQFGALVQPQEAESSFEQLLQQRTEQLFLAESLESADQSRQALPPLQSLLVFLLRLTEEEISDAFGEEAMDEIRHWQQQAEELMSDGDELSFHAIDELMRSLFAILPHQFESRSDAAANAIPLHAFQQELPKTLLSRMLNAFEPAQQQDNRRTESMPLQLQKLDAPAAAEKYAFSQIRKLLAAPLSDAVQQTDAKAAEQEAILHHEEKKGHRFANQQNVLFTQSAMDRIHQLEFRIQRFESESTSIAMQIERLLASSQLRTLKNGSMELHVRLHPDHLGSLSIKLTQQDGQIIARIAAQTESAKHLIESQLHQLRHAFAAQHLQVEKIEVFVQNSELQQHSPKSNQEEKNEHGMTQQNSKENRDEDEEEQSFQEWLKSLIR